MFPFLNKTNAIISRKPIPKIASPWRSWRLWSLPFQAHFTIIHPLLQKQNSPMNRELWRLEPTPHTIQLLEHRSLEPDMPCSDTRLNPSLKAHGLCNSQKESSGWKLRPMHNFLLEFGFLQTSMQLSVAFHHRITKSFQTEETLKGHLV